MSFIGARCVARFVCFFRLPSQMCFRHSLIAAGDDLPRRQTPIWQLQKTAAVFWTKKWSLEVKECCSPFLFAMQSNLVYTIKDIIPQRYVNKKRTYRARKPLCVRWAQAVEKLHVCQCLFVIAGARSGIPGPEAGPRGN